MTFMFFGTFQTASTEGVLGCDPGGPGKGRGAGQKGGAGFSGQSGGSTGVSMPNENVCF